MSRPLNRSAHGRSLLGALLQLPDQWAPVPAFVAAHYQYLRQQLLERQLYKN